MYYNYRIIVIRLKNWGYRIIVIEVNFLVVGAQHCSTGSKQVLEDLGQLGQSCSYTEILRIDAVFSNGELEKARKVSAIIPTQSPTIQPGKGMAHAVADNDDFLEDTIDDKHNTRTTTMVFYRNQPTG